MAICAPNALRQLIVADISSDIPRQIRVLSLWAKALQINNRCAWDLEAGITTLPLRVPAWIRRFISIPHSSAN